MPVVTETTEPQLPVGTVLAYLHHGFAGTGPVSMSTGTVIGAPARDLRTGRVWIPVQDNGPMPVWVERDHVVVARGGVGSHSRPNVRHRPALRLAGRRHSGRHHWPDQARPS